ncbi:hypothetical protein MSSAC_4319 [Methanosarcina siciliae C2J]|uniref:DUF1673 domain-containing protein n=1 Tax=Methanosarcina siciliae C2J TaxID=1434118 RepID=A0A0E3PUW5_9EURY|nr:DUF1673 domain-containing protein [Methanosarcina siciliae]AKB38909.1 hypothetical protein MSSAC_4319 [Methanosarcina siciliae C2J]
MSLKVENIKKLMGWCPNAREFESRRHISLENFGSDIPDRAKGENGDLKNPGWLRKLSTRTLLISTSFTFVYFLELNQIGMNRIFLLAGSFSYLLLRIFFWKAITQSRDELVKCQVIEYSIKKRIIRFAITYAVCFLIYLYLNLKGQELDLQAMFSFVGGVLVWAWLGYFQLIYWERKNHKTIYFDKGYGKWKNSYIIRERK